MASAQVLPSSRKLGHLEAGKKKLEEFRKKKAEGRAKKAASTGQLIPADADQSEKDSQKYEHARDGAKATADTNPYRLDMTGESKTVSSSQSTEFHSSSRTHGSSPLLIESNQVSHDESVQSDGKEVPKSHESSGFPGHVNGYYDQWKGSSELTHEKETSIGQADGSATDQFDASNFLTTNSARDINNTNSRFLSSFTPSPGENRNLSKALTTHPETSYANSASTFESPAGFSWQSRLGHPSTSASTSGLHKESSFGVVHPGSLYKKNTTDIGIGGGKIADSIDHNLNVDDAHWHGSEPPYKDSSLVYKGSQSEYAFASSGFGTSSGRSRPSFLDSLGVSRVSSMAHVPYSEPGKASTLGSFDDLKFQSTDVPLSTPLQPFAEFNSVAQSTTDFRSDNELSTNTFISSNSGLNSTADHRAQIEHELFTSKKDEDFASLEQHIEDLTQEKFSLQRALDTSRTLAESLAAENSSLTESYNQQGKIISQLKFDMERLQEEMKGQLTVLDSMRSEYMNAQLECTAADERAKILASEIIGLEEKALRLRSNELKLEKQLENLNSEIASYKRKVSILEKERQDFQSTIDALQEEKKLLQSKLRKASKDEKVNVKKTSFRRDVSTSTEDLGTEPSNLVDGVRSIHSSTDVSTSSLVPEDIPFALLDSSDNIPQDQLRMIENINSLISELALEKEELVGALKIESSNCAKLKDLNKDLSQKLEAQTQRYELLTAQRMASDNILARPIDTHNVQDLAEYADEGDEVVERVLGWIMKLFPGGPSKRRTSKLL